MAASTPTVRSRRILASLLLLGALAACPGAPAQAGVFSISPARERKLGQDNAVAIERGSNLVTGPVLAWVQAVGARLAKVSNPEFTYSFQVVDSPDVNAFTLPGGYIYVCTGLRKVVRTDDELAAVLAHEITHAELHHYAKQYAHEARRSTLFAIGSLALGLPQGAQEALNVMDFSLGQKYSRAHESEADHQGMLRLARAGYDPAAMVTILQRLALEGPHQDALDRWMSDHPDGLRRVRDAQAELAQLRASGAALPAAPAPAPAPAPNRVLQVPPAASPTSAASSAAAPSPRS